MRDSELRHRYDLIGGVPPQEEAKCIEVGGKVLVLSLADRLNALCARSALEQALNTADVFFFMKK